MFGAKLGVKDGKWALERLEFNSLCPRVNTSNTWPKSNHTAFSEISEAKAHLHLRELQEQHVP